LLAGVESMLERCRLQGLSSGLKGKSEATFSWKARLLLLFPARRSALTGQLRLHNVVGSLWAE
jgi:hypothetical protein